jgi:hypothetical protein
MLVTSRAGIMCAVRRAVLSLVVVLVLPGCGEKTRVTPVDELRGTYRGVGIGDTTAAVYRVFGKQPLSGPREPITPRKEEFVEIGGPTVISEPCGTAPNDGPMSLRYDHVSFFICDGRVDGFIVAQNGARTRRGITVGDDADRVQARYPLLRCGTAPFEGGSYPYCGGRIGKHRWLWFGRDPVRSITVARVPLLT